jgi:glycine cleavage system H protein
MEPKDQTALPYRRARFTTSLPLNYLYSPSHYWISQGERSLWRVGLTTFATRMFGEMVDHGFGVDAGAILVPGQIIGWIEGFKAIADVYCIAEGSFAGGNAALKAEILLLNRDPYGAGWLYAVHGKPDAKCVDARGYAAILDQTIDRLLEKQAAQQDEP